MESTSNEEKDILARSIVQAIASRNGRFLQKVESNEQFVALGIPKSVKVAYVLATEEVILTKTKQCIRDTFKRSIAVDAARSPPPKKRASENGGEHHEQPENIKVPRVSRNALMQNQDVVRADVGLSSQSRLHRFPTSLAGVDADSYMLSALSLPPRGRQSQSWLRQGLNTGRETLQQEQLLRSAGLSIAMQSSLFPQHSRELAFRGSHSAATTDHAWQLAAATASATPDSLSPTYINPLLSARNDNERAQLVGEILRMGTTNDVSTSLSPQQRSSMERADFEAEIRNAALVSLIRRQCITSQQQNEPSAALQRSQQSHHRISSAEAHRLLQQYRDGVLSNAVTRPQHGQALPLSFHQWTTQQPQALSNLLIQLQLQLPSIHNLPDPLQQALQARNNDQQQLEISQQLERLLQQVGRSGNNNTFQTIRPQTLSLTSSATSAAPTPRAEAKGRDSSPEELDR